MLPPTISASTRENSSFSSTEGLPSRICYPHRPESYPDGYYWSGAIKDRCGLFRPTDTVAFLGAETPQRNSQPIAVSLPEMSAKTKEKTKEKEKKKEKERPVISGPQGDVRHTFHLGADGGVFGLLQVSFSQASNCVVAAGEGHVPSGVRGPLHLVRGLLLAAVARLADVNSSRKRHSAEAVASPCDALSPSTSGAISQTDYRPSVFLLLNTVSFFDHPHRPSFPLESSLEHVHCGPSPTPGFPRPSFSEFHEQRFG